MPFHSTFNIQHPTLLKIFLEEGILISKGQMLFFLICVLLFGALMIVLYKQDIKRSPDYFKGTWKVFVGMFIVMALIVIIFMSRK
jgi:hypothetical protein